MKQLSLVVNDLDNKWDRSFKRGWDQILEQIAIKYENRLSKYLF
ncbi:hypothetical protein [uncultured Ilyobacter sp.]|nr:hypothetical protein [uncultured Ilyobacter sp.]